jgi:uncharacterized UPF0160 family protein
MMETKEILRHKKPYHLDDFLAVSMLKALYPNAEVKEIHPQDDKEIIEEAKKDSIKILVDVGGDYNPDMRNYDHHQDAELPSSVKLVMENELNSKILEKIESNEYLKNALEIIDKIDREGFPKVSKEYGIKVSNLTRTVLTTLLQNSYDEKLGEKLLKEPEKFNRENFENAVNKILSLIEENRKELIDSLNEELHLTEEEKQLVNQYLENLTKEKESIVDTIRMAKENYTGFIYQAVVESKAINRFLPNLERALKQEVENNRILKEVKTLEVDGLKVGIYLGDKPLPQTFLFSKGYQIAIVPNAMNPEDISVVKNTNSPLTGGIDIKGLAEKLGEVKFVHKAGFIAVVDGKKLKVSKDDIPKVVEKELKNQLGKKNKLSL